LITKKSLFVASSWSHLYLLTHRILAFLIRIDVLKIYDLLSVSGKLAANRAISAAQATA